VQYALGVPEVLVSLHVLGAALVTVAAAALWASTVERPVGVGSRDAGVVAGATSDGATAGSDATGGKSAEKGAADSPSEAAGLSRTGA
jgi:heme a synthase